MPEVLSGDGVRLHAEVDGEGEPVTVFAHGLTNSCMEMAAFTPFAPGTKVRFCFRGHGHAGVPDEGHYGFADYAMDVDAVATAFGATNAVGTSLGAGAITRLLGEQPDRFERVVFVLPAALDRPLAGHPLSMRTAELDPVGVARAIRGLIGEVAIADRKLLRRVQAPVLLIAREGDPMHPIAVARAMVEHMPNAELIELGSEDDLFDAIPTLVERVARFLA